MSALKAVGLKKEFGAETLFDQVSFDVMRGDKVGFVGPNGAGKTTTFYMIVGFYRPTSGDVFLDGKRITVLPMYARARLGISYLPREPSVFKKLTVEENIWAILETRRDLSFDEKKMRLEQLISEFDIGKIRRQQAITLSGGERQRIGLARAFLHDAPIMFLDEPTSNLDSLNEGIILKSLNEKSKRKTVVIVSHRMSTLNIAHSIFEMQKEST